MFKPVLTICVAITISSAAAFADDDVVRIKLDAAKLAYEQEMAKNRRVVHEWIDQREDTARKDGNKKAVDLIKAERRAFDEKNDLPRNVPDEFRQNFLKARATLEAAYNTAVKEYVQVKKDYEATVVEKELARLKSTPLTVVPTPVAGGGSPVITPEMLKAKLAGKATYDPKTGILTVSYKFADKKELEDFDCGEAKPKLVGGYLKIDPATAIKHVVEFDTVKLFTVVNVHAMRGPVLSTTLGTSLHVGGLHTDTMYLNNKGFGHMYQVVSDKSRSGAIRVEMDVEEKNVVMRWGTDKLGRELKEPGAGQVYLHGGDAGYGFGSLTISGKVNAKWADKFFGLTPEGEKTAAIERILLGTWRIECPDGYKAEWTFKPDGTVSATKGPSQSGKWEIDLKKEQVLCIWQSGLIDRFDFPLDPKLTTGGTVGRGKLKLEAVKLP